MIDFPRFFEAAWLVVVLTRLQIVFDLASDERLAAQMFGAYSATARLRLIAQVLSLRTVRDPGEGPPSPLVVVQ